MKKVKIVHELAKGSAKQIIDIESHINLIKEFDKKDDMNIDVNLSDLIKDLDKSRKIIEKIQIKMSEIKKQERDF